MNKANSRTIENLTKRIDEIEGRQEQIDLHTTVYTHLSKQIVHTTVFTHLSNQIVHTTVYAHQNK